MLLALQAKANGGEQPQIFRCAQDDNSGWGERSKAKTQIPPLRFASVGMTTIDLWWWGKPSPELERRQLWATWPWVVFRNTFVAGGTREGRWIFPVGGGKTAACC